MSLIGSKRLQQGIFEALASQNRFAGSGGGSGMAPIQHLGGAGNTNTGLTITSTTPTVVSGASLTFNLSRASWVMLSLDVTAKTSGASGAFSYSIIFLDSADAGYARLIWDKGVGGLTASSKVLLLYSTASASPLPPGSHTVDIRVQCDAGQTWNNAVTEFAVWQLGY